MKNIEKRKLKSSIAIWLSVLAAATGMFWLAYILASILVRGFSSINWNMFIKDPTPPGITGGGLRSAFIGQGIITILASIIGIPLGILAGTYIAEYGRNSWFASIISNLSDIMVSIPSIVVGVFVYKIVVRPMGHFSGYAGAVSLAIIMIPIILRSTEDMLKLVPWELREAAFALGAPYYRVIRDVVYRGAATGLFTGILLGVARVAAETAPLLFTSFNNPYLTLNPNQPMPSLTVTIYQYAMGPYSNWHKLAWGASFVIVVTILFINIIGRFIIKKRYSK